MSYLLIYLYINHYYCHSFKVCIRAFVSHIRCHVDRCM